MKATIKNRLAQAGRLWRTVRHLRPVQVYGRLWFRFYQPVPAPLPAPELREQSGVWREPAERASSMIAPGRFRFLNHEEELSDIGWDGPFPDKLWRYNQHYFEDLVASGWQERMAWHEPLILDWIAHNTPGQGTGWESYPTSLRIINWIKWAKSGRILSYEVRNSLAMQLRWLMGRIEWHLQGNHLFINAKALIFGGLFFAGAEAERWLSRGNDILRAQLPEQFLSDGAQFELSPMYHALAVEDLLDLLNIMADHDAEKDGELVRMLRDTAKKALCWLTAMCHPDGNISFFNDAAFGIAPSTDALLSYAERLGVAQPENSFGLTHLQDSGYVRMQLGDAVLLADLAEVGPDYIPGHAHADTLSFELSLGVERLFVNSGTSIYGSCRERLRQRGTSAHNTVEVEGGNSSEVWSGFRVGRRARPTVVDVCNKGGSLIAHGTHDGYRKLVGHPVTSRTFSLASNRLMIIDKLVPARDAVARYHLHPAVSIESTTARGAILRLASGRLVTISIEGEVLRTESATWHPFFGTSQSTQCLVLPLVSGHACFIASWD